MHQLRSVSPICQDFLKLKKVISNVVRYCAILKNEGWFKPKIETFIRNDVKDENLDYIRIVPKIETLDRNSSYIFLFLIVDPMRIRLYESL